MYTIAEIEKRLAEPLDEKSIRYFNGGGKGKIGYLSGGDVALALNYAFGSAGWSYNVDKLEKIYEKRVDPRGVADETGSHWLVGYMALVTIRVRALSDAVSGAFEEISRQDVGFGTPYGNAAMTDKQLGETNGYEFAMKEAVTNGVKRAASLFGPRTGLTLRFKENERDAVQEQIEAARQDSTPATQSPSVPKNDARTKLLESLAGTPAPAAQTPAATATQVPAPKPTAATNGTATNGAQSKETPVVPALPEVLTSLAPEPVVAKILTLPTNDSRIEPADLNILHGGFAKAFGADSALLWGAVGVKLAKGAVVTKANVLTIATLLEQHGSKGSESLAKWFESLRAASNGAAQAPASAAQPTQDLLGVQFPPPATAQAPASAPVPTSTTGGQTHGQIVQEAWKESEAVIQERMTRYEQKIGSSIEPKNSSTVLKALATTPDNDMIDGIVGGTIHAIAIERLGKHNILAEKVFDIWRKVGFVQGPGVKPTGKQAREFADMILPDEVSA